MTCSLDDIIIGFKVGDLEVIEPGVNCICTCHRCNKTGVRREAKALVKAKNMGHDSACKKCVRISKSKRRIY